MISGYITFGLLVVFAIGFVVGVCKIYREEEKERKRNEK